MFRGLCACIQTSFSQNGFPTKLFILLNLENSAIFSPLTLPPEQLKSSPQKNCSATSSPNKPTPPPSSSSSSPLSSSATPGLQASLSRSKPCKYGLRQNRRRPSTREVSCWLQEVSFPHNFSPQKLPIVRCCIAAGSRLCSGDRGGSPGVQEACLYQSGTKERLCSPPEEHLWETAPRGDGRRGRRRGRGRR